ncbi:MAG: hypothetical protein EAZ92_08720 [Candidatus Kapaibacterium sp.]|nr:MAG: hypothetical protein EAZ92_08720 [Candidatus Kapabacteria bacterium]
MSFRHQYPLDEHTFVEVIRESDASNGGASSAEGASAVHWQPRVEFHLHARDASTGTDGSYVEVARMMLRSLEPITPDFSANDFVQHGLKSVQPGKGYAHKLHDFVVSHHKNFPFPVENIYSTEPSIDNIYFVQRNQPRLYMSESAKMFWGKRVKAGKAEYIEALKRFRIKWE